MVYTDSVDISRIMIYSQIKRWNDYLALIIKDQYLPTLIRNLDSAVMVNKAG